MKPTETLIAEHEMIVQMLAEADRVAKAPGKLDQERTEGLIEFFVNFADRLHHAKEETLLFPRLEERGLPHDSGPLAIMLMEHDEGRSFLKAARMALPKAKQGEPQAVATVRDSLRGFAELLQAHIHKENMILFRMADEILTPNDQCELEAAFAKVNGVDLADVRKKQFEFFRRVAGKPTTK